MIQFEQTVRQGAPMTIVEISGGDDPIYAGRIYRGDSGQFFVEPSRATQDQICEGVFGTREAAEKYVAKCLKGADMQTTEADVTVERAKARREAKARVVTPAPKPVSKPRKKTLGEKIEAIAETAEREKVGRYTKLKKDGKIVGLEAENGTVVVLEDAIAEKHGMVTKDDTNAEVVAANRAVAALKAIEGKSAAEVNAVVIKAIEEAEKPTTCPDCEKPNGGWGNRKDGLCKACYCKRIGPCTADGCTNMAFHKTKKLCEKHLRANGKAA